jgi:hypothetical protein
LGTGAIVGGGLVSGERLGGSGVLSAGGVAGTDSTGGAAIGGVIDRPSANAKSAALVL